MRKTKKALITGFGVALLLVLGFAIFFWLNFKTVVVTGQSMEPTFTDKQRVLMSKAYWLIGPIEEKDIVVIQDDENSYIIKRVYKTAGQTVDWFNVPEDYPLSENPYVVPQGTVYVLGDNRERSEDSRLFGPVELNRILGKVVIRP